MTMFPVKSINIKHLRFRQTHFRPSTANGPDYHANPKRYASKGVHLIWRLGQPLTTALIVINIPFLQRLQH